jgi:soluble lytic murein transglycosylase-like protein
MQLMPGTARELGVDNALIAEENIRGGVNYLAKMLKRFHGDTKLATAAYNAGPNAVGRYGGVPPYAETKAYVNRVDILRERYATR